ncbi:hypothetical protein QLQ12_13270 [Actinoplanes sp. NEAU-A12]|uniref:Lipoprotein n=1 Tax=Actinoplanes sandaracinus TaxID=3045177 RepID=A0ABT6WIK9_9ACTN|nr:hypothetical protein [Actinoplanes sandaracinus]MDI6099568.1 hypothetical protein [Actinoplanes sandaracinus]
MRANYRSVAVAVVLSLTGCAGPGAGRPGSQATGPDRVAVVVTATGVAPPGVVVPIPSPVPPPGSATAACARAAMPRPAIDPSASFVVRDPGEGARRALAQKHRPTPRRGVVPEAAVPGAQACVDALRTEFALRMRGSHETPGGPVIDVSLRSAGLTQIVIGSASFAASTGAACVYGTFAAAGPEFAIGPVAADGSCPP